MGRPLSVFAALAVATVLAVGGEARAADDEIRMQVDAGMGRVVRGGTWTPVRVELENPGPGVEGAVVVRFSESGQQKGASREPVELATGAKKRVTVYARPRPGPGSLEVSFEDERGRVLVGPRDVSIQAADGNDVVVALVSMGGRGDPGMRPLTSENTRIAVLDAEELPEAWPALDTFDALVLRDPDTTRLGPARVEAIKAWVSAGGVLVVSAGEKWRAMDDPAFTELLPVRLEGVRTVDAKRLPEPFGRYDGPVAMAVSSPLRGASLVTAPGGEPLVSEASYGLGRVVFLAIDPGDLAGVPAYVKAGLWRDVLLLPAEEIVDPNNPGYYYGSHNTPAQFIQQELSRIPPLQPPSVLLVTALIGLYVLVVGPGDYFLLKRIGKLHWTWVTYPAAIAAFSGLIYLYATLTRSSDMMVRTLALVDAPAEPPGAPAPVRVFGGVYSPRAGRYQVDIKAPIGAMAGSFSETDLYGGGAKGEYAAVGGPKPSILLSIPIWSMAGVEFATESDEPPPFLVEALPDGSVKVTNTGDEALEYVGLLVERRVIDGGRLEPGKDVRIRRDDTGRRLADLPSEMASTQYGAAKTKQDLGRIVRVFAYATDPPATGEGDYYYTPRQERHRSWLERPRADRGDPMVFALARTKPMIAVHGERVSGDGLTIWRRPVRSH